VAQEEAGRGGGEEVRRKKVKGRSNQGGYKRRGAEN
jgi:hypothetical protein